MDDLDWDEKDYDDPQVFNEEEEEIRPRGSYSKRILTRIIDKENYPFDIWFLIGTYIAPEDIGRFALICRTTNRVVNTPAFWISTFNRYGIHLLLSKRNLNVFILDTVNLKQNDTVDFSNGNISPSFELM